MKSKRYCRVVALSLVLVVATLLWLASPVLLVHAQGYGYGGGGGGGGGKDTSPPRFSDILVTNITKTSADISWETHEKSNSQIEYWASLSVFTPMDVEMVREHLVHLTSLTPATNYHFVVRSEDKSGNLGVSDESTFLTLGTPAAFTTSLLTLSTPEVDVGEEVTISILVSNTGDAPGSYEVVLKINEAVVDTKEVTLAGGASQAVTFTVAEDVAGTCEVSIDSLTDTFVVKAIAPPVTPPPATTPPVLPPPAKPFNWWLIGGIIAVVAAAAVFVWQTYRRRAA